MMMSQMSILLEVYYTISDTGGLGADGLTVTIKRLSWNIMHEL